MILAYARIADRVVADEYASVCTQIDALYNTAATPGALPAEIETAAMTRLRQQAHARMLGNGLCTRPVKLECHMETAGETCAYFTTGPEFVPVLLRQRDHARDHNQPHRATLYDNLIQRAGALLTAITCITPAARHRTSDWAIRCLPALSTTTPTGSAVRPAVEPTDRQRRRRPDIRRVSRFAAAA